MGEAAKEKVRSLEEDPPKKLEDWPDDAAKYETFGGPEGEAGYDEGPTRKLGPSGVTHEDDGSVTLAEDVDAVRVSLAHKSLRDPDSSSSRTVDPCATTVKAPASEKSARRPCCTSR